MKIDYEAAANAFEEIPAIGAARRCGVQWTPWMGDWFTSWSPRNSNDVEAIVPAEDARDLARFIVDMFAKRLDLSNGE